MKDESVVKLALCVAAAGIAALLVLAFVAEPSQIEIGRLSERDSGKQVMIGGIVDDKSVDDGNIFLTLNDGTGSITVVMFERSARGTTAYDVQLGKSAQIRGQVSIYKGELEIIANSIEVE